jgi:thiamine transport system ATP-binding protein
MLEATDLTVDLGSKRVLHDVSIKASPGRVTAILGPSGCGKTTLLRAVAGLTPISAGRIVVGGHDVTALPAHRRGVALVFQDHALFPHRDVGGNVGFGLRMRQMPEDDRRGRVAEVLEMVGLPGSERRPIQELSGGERQRVALARALAPEPAVLMMDEPLRSLDRAIRDRLLDELSGIVRSLGCTVVYVTHDTTETFHIADQVALMRDGRIVQSGELESVWRTPTDEPAARLLGHVNFADALVANGRLKFGWADLPWTGSGNGAVRVVIRPDAVRLGGRDASGEIVATRFDGDRVALSIQVAPGVILVVGRPPSPPSSVGERVSLGIDPEGVVVLPD